MYIVYYIGLSMYLIWKQNDKGNIWTRGMKWNVGGIEVIVHWIVHEVLTLVKLRWIWLIEHVIQVGQINVFRMLLWKIFKLAMKHWG